MRQENLKFIQHPYASNKFCSTKNAPKPISSVCFFAFVIHRISNTHTICSFALLILRTNFVNSLVVDFLLENSMFFFSFLLKRFTDFPHSEYFRINLTLINQPFTYTHTNKLFCCCCCSISVLQHNSTIYWMNYVNLIPKQINTRMHTHSRSHSWQLYFCMCVCDQQILYKVQYHSVHKCVCVCSHVNKTFQNTTILSAELYSGCQFPKIVIIFVFV